MKPTENKIHDIDVQLLRNYKELIDNGRLISQMSEDIAELKSRGNTRRRELKQERKAAQKLTRPQSEDSSMPMRYESMVGQRWTAGEIERLREGIREFGKDYDQITEYVGGRSIGAVK